MSGANVTASGDSYKFSGVQEHWDVRGGIDEKLFHFNEGDRGTAERMPELIKEIDFESHKLPDGTMSPSFKGGVDGHEYDARPEDEFWREPGVWTKANGKIIGPPPIPGDDDDIPAHARPVPL